MIIVVIIVQEVVVVVAVLKFVKFTYCTPRPAFYPYISSVSLQFGPLWHDRYHYSQNKHISNNNNIYKTTEMEGGWGVEKYRVDTWAITIAGDPSSP